MHGTQAALSGGVFARRPLERWLGRLAKVLLNDLVRPQHY